jgi:hypothetical protein
MVLAVSAATLLAPSPASAASNSCSLQVTYPSLVPDANGPYVAGGGRVSCTSSAESITVHVEVHIINNDLFGLDNPIIGDYTATRRPGFQLLSLDLIRSPRCLTGFTYYTDMTGSATWKGGFMSGRAVSPTRSTCT